MLVSHSGCCFNSPAAGPARSGSMRRARSSSRESALGGVLACVLCGRLGTGNDDMPPRFVSGAVDSRGAVSRSSSSCTCAWICGGTDAYVGGGMESCLATPFMTGLEVSGGGNATYEYFQMATD